VHGVRAGKPLTLHGSYGREYATGRGVVLAVRELLRAEHLGKIAGKDFVIQARVPALHAQVAVAAANPHLTCLPVLAHGRTALDPW
jgi:glutamate dehydrogenase/leucine dehydrogenase